MNTKKIATLLAFLENADRIFAVDNSAFISGVTFSFCEGHPENEVILFTWEDEIGNEFRVRITEDGLNNAIVENNTLTMIDDEGDPFAVTVFKMVRQTIPTNW